MQSGINGILHFAGHGSASRGDGGIPLYLVELEDGSLDPETWKGAAAAAPSNMIVFFNACDIGQADFGVGSLMGWAPASLSAGARGFIGGLWPVFDRAAADATARFYSSLLKEPQGYVTAALRNVRAGYAETGDPSYLAYAYYGDVNLMAEREK
jgi:CHAT domain-containing protein